jgi:replicative DNA helicase
MESEQSTLGAMLMDTAAIDIAMNMVNAEDFYRENHRKIFTACIDLYLQQSSVDLITVVEELRRRQQLGEVGGPAYLTALIEGCPSSAAIKSYILPLIRASVMRQALAATEVLSTRLYSGEEDGLLAVRDAMARLEEIKERAVLNEPVKTMTADVLASTEFPDVKWIVPNMIPQGLVLMLGKPKVGKSFLAQTLALSVAAGGHFLGKLKVDQGEVLYIALEDTFRRLQSRQTSLLQGEPAPADLHMEVEWPHAGNGGIERIERWLSLHTRARLIVIDVLQKFRSPRKGDDIYGEDYRALGAIKDIADKHEIAIVILHHQSKKDSDDQFEKSSGTNAIIGAADAMMAIERKRKSNEATLHITGRDVGEEQFAMEWDGNIKSWALLGDADAVEADSTRNAIIRILQNESDSLSPQELADETDRNYATVRVVLRELVNEGRIMKVGRGKYCIPTARNATTGAAMSAKDD